MAAVRISEVPLGGQKKKTGSYTYWLNLPPQIGQLAIAKIQPHLSDQSCVLLVQ